MDSGLSNETELSALHHMVVPPAVGPEQVPIAAHEVMPLAGEVAVGLPPSGVYWVDGTRIVRTPEGVYLFSIDTSARPGSALWPVAISDLQLVYAYGDDDVLEIAEGHATSVLYLVDHFDAHERRTPPTIYLYHPDPKDVLNGDGLAPTAGSGEHGVSLTETGQGSFWTRYSFGGLPDGLGTVYAADRYQTPILDSDGFVNHAATSAWRPFTDRALAQPAYYVPKDALGDGFFRPGHLYRGAAETSATRLPFRRRTVSFVAVPLHRLAPHANPLSVQLSRAAQKTNPPADARVAIGSTTTLDAVVGVDSVAAAGKVNGFQPTFTAAAAAVIADGVVDGTSSNGEVGRGSSTVVRSSVRGAGG